jgi:hypothetical protein
MPTILRPRALDITPKPYDLIVDAAGGADGTVIQTVLDAGGTDFTAWIKQGTYAAGFTEASNGAKIFVEPGTVIQAAVTLSGNDITLVLGSGCDVQGVITLSGDNCKLLCQNGVDLDGILVSGAKGLVDGGGWDTHSNGGTAAHGVAVSGADCIVQNIQASTTAGGGSVFLGVSVSGTRASIIGVKIPDSDATALILDTDAEDALVAGCVILGADSQGIRVVAGRARIIGNYLKDIADDAINPASAAASNCLMVGNIIQDQGASCVDIAAAAENCVCVGNRTDGAVSDSSGTSTVANNDETAF